MYKSQIWFESDTHQVSIGQAQQGFYAVNLYRKEDGQFMMAAGVHAESFDQAFESWKSKLLNDYPQLAECFYTPEELDEELLSIELEDCESDEFFDECEDDCYCE